MGVPSQEAAAIGAGRALGEDGDGGLTVKTCDTCKYWDIDSGDDFGFAGHNLCKSPKMLRGYHHFGKPIPDDGALVENDEGWAIITGPKFGCVNSCREGRALGGVR